MPKLAKTKRGFQFSPEAATAFDQLDALFTQKYGYHIPVNSAYRDPAHNAAIGGAPGSDHTLGLAWDTNYGEAPKIASLISQVPGWVQGKGQYYRPGHGWQSEVNHFYFRSGGGKPQGNFNTANKPQIANTAKPAVLDETLAPIPDVVPLEPKQSPSDYNRQLVWNQSQYNPKELLNNPYGSGEPTAKITVSQPQGAQKPMTTATDRLNQYINDTQGQINTTFQHKSPGMGRAVGAGILGLLAGGPLGAVLLGGAAAAGGARRANAYNMEADKAKLAATLDLPQSTKALMDALGMAGTGDDTINWRNRMTGREDASYPMSADQAQAMRESLSNANMLGPMQQMILNTQNSAFGVPMSQYSNAQHVVSGNAMTPQQQVPGLPGGGGNGQFAPPAPGQWNEAYLSNPVTQYMIAGMVDAGRNGLDAGQNQLLIPANNNLLLSRGMNERGQAQLNNANAGNVKAEIPGTRIKSSMMDKIINAETRAPQMNEAELVWKAFGGDPNKVANYLGGKGQGNSTQHLQQMMTAYKTAMDSYQIPNPDGKGMHYPGPNEPGYAEFQALQNESSALLRGMLMGDEGGGSSGGMAGYGIPSFSEFSQQSQQAPQKKPKSKNTNVMDLTRASGGF